VDVPHCRRAHAHAHGHPTDRASPRSGRRCPRSGEFLGSSPGWQTWDLKPENGGTLVTMEEEYTVPGSVLGKVVDRLIFEKMNARDMHSSLENLKLLIEAPNV
jgi:uncharacterized membrane protein